MISEAISIRYSLYPTGASMTEEMELVGLPVSFSSTKVIKKTERNRQKKAQKKRKNKMNKNTQISTADHVDHFNYAEEFKIQEVLTEYKSPFTILMPKQERYKSEEEEYFESEEYEDECEDEYEGEQSVVVYDENCKLDYGFEEPSLDVNVPSLDTESKSTDNTLTDTPAPAKKAKNTSMQKYYQQRYDYFSRFDEGIHIDEEGWYSVTPELIADHIAQEAHSIAQTNRKNTNNSGELVILDAFCGVGGNTIQFARYFDRVIAVDLDSTRLEMAKNNAQVYGVADKITFIHGDVFEVLQNTKETLRHADLVFMSPPWGGPDYINQPIFCPRRHILNNRGEELFLLGRTLSPNLILFLPRQSDISVIAEMLRNEKISSLKEDDSFVVEQHWLRNRIKAISIYFYS